MSVEPAASRWRFPHPSMADENGLVAVGGDLEPGTLLAAYRSGLFPMHVQDGRQLAWWSPDPRGVIPLEGLRVSRSLRQSCRRFDIRVNTAFDQVVASCADPSRPFSWINDDIATAYRRLHELGWAHSVEAWSLDDGVLAGGLYGVSVGGLFAGESMFHHRRDASKVALVGLMRLLSEDGVDRLLDVQWATDHLQTLGALEIPRADYLRRLKVALGLPSPPALVPNYEAS